MFKLVVDREKEIENFVFRGYYLIEVLIFDLLIVEIYMFKYIVVEKIWVFFDELEFVKKSIDILLSNILVVKDIKEFKKILLVFIFFK